MDVRVVDLLPEHIEDIYPGEENAVRREWVSRMMKKGLRRKLAYDAQGAGIS